MISTFWNFINQLIQGVDYIPAATSLRKQPFQWCIYIKKTFQKKKIKHNLESAYIWVKRGAGRPITLPTTGSGELRHVNDGSHIYIFFFFPERKTFLLNFYFPGRGISPGKLWETFLCDGVRRQVDLLPVQVGEEY